MGRVQLHDHSFHHQGGPTRMLHSTVFSHDILFLFLETVFTSIFGPATVCFELLCECRPFAYYLYMGERFQAATNLATRLSEHSHPSLLAWPPVFQSLATRLS
jgi:hypothetical protein